uniref:Uncharacterized protein n=1 Tax=Rhizophora mucronata TaxID=61149 RepID=A0A2P2QBK4_RHIMU
MEIIKQADKVGASYVGVNCVVGLI